MSQSVRISQKGAALVLVLLSLLLGAGSYLLQRSVSGRTNVLEATDAGMRAQRLLQARRALLRYAVAYADNYLPTGAGPGHLPCPDRSPIDDGNDGNDGPDPPCRRSDSNIGRFPRFTYSRDQPGKQPQKRIEFYPELSLQDQQMWYAVSRSHINNPVATVVNPSTRGQLRVDSIDDIVAVIIEPGTDLSSGQSSRPGDSISAYLEVENADSDAVYSQAGNAGANDLLVYLTAAQLMEPTRLRVMQFVSRWIMEFNQRHCGAPGLHCYPAAGDARTDCVDGSNDGYLPLFPGSCRASLAHDALLDGVDAERHWFVRNSWPGFFRYQRDPQCIDGTQVTCTVDFDVPADLQAPITVSIVPTELPVSGRSKSRKDHDPGN